MRYLLIFALLYAIVAPASCREHRKFRKHKNPGVRVTRRDNAVRQIMDDSTRRDDDEVFRKGQYFQDIFAEHLEPLKIQFGHVCEDPHEWEQRFERKDLKNNRYQGKVRWGNENEEYGEHYWDLNHGQ